MQCHLPLARIHHTNDACKSGPETLFASDSWQRLACLQIGYSGSVSELGIPEHFTLGRRTADGVAEVDKINAFKDAQIWGACLMTPVCEYRGIRYANADRYPARARAGIWADPAESCDARVELRATGYGGYRSADNSTRTHTARRWGCATHDWISVMTRPAPIASLGCTWAGPRSLQTPRGAGLRCSGAEEQGGGCRLFPDLQIWDVIAYNL